MTSKVKVEPHGLTAVVPLLSKAIPAEAPVRIPPRLDPSSVADYCGGRAAVASCVGGWTANWLGPLKYGLRTFNNGDCHARGRKPRSQRRACLAGPDDDGIETPRHETPPLRKIAGHLRRVDADDDDVIVAHVGSSVPACSATIYAAYQAGQFSSRCPVRFSCCPWAASARRSALARS